MCCIFVFKWQNQCRYLQSESVLEKLKLCVLKQCVVFVSFLPRRCGHFSDEHLNVYLGLHFFVLFATGHKVFLGQFWVRVWLAFVKRWEVGGKEFLLERCSLGLSQPTALCVSYVGLTYTGAASIASRVEPPYEPP